jgi:MoaA/NifB/PqqE/SkfB family radical SAM enzyme
MEICNTTSLAWDHWHIEASSVCSLRCPRCPRSEVPESLLNASLTLNFFQKQIGKSIIEKIKKITFCGNDGDPIYCKEFIEICEWIKQINPKLQITIVTNGSYRQVDWWTRLANTLNLHDEIHWSIDGWDQQSNEQYRVNCNWQSIISGIETFTKYNNSTYRVWASIGFSFNEYNIDTLINLARKWKFDLFQLTKSTKFGSKYPAIYGESDLLEPETKKLISSSHRFEREKITLSEKIRPVDSLKKVFLQRAEKLAKHSAHSAICFIGNKGVFLNSRGEFYPCCWTATRYEHNRSWQELANSRFNLYNNTFEEILSDPYWNTDFLKFDSFECRTKCTPEKLSDIEHTTEW